MNGYRYDETRREFIDSFTGEVYRRGIDVYESISGATREQKASIEEGMGVLRSFSDNVREETFS